MLILEYLTLAPAFKRYYDKINSLSISYSDEFPYFKRIFDKQILELSEEQIRSTGYVIDTLEASIWVFFHTSGYREAVLKAANLGGDTDTIAAITGGMAGAYYGFEDIPDKWIQNITQKEELYHIYKDFVTIQNQREAYNEQFGTKVPNERSLAETFLRMGSE